MSDALQSFTAIGQVGEGEPYVAEIGGGFQPFRRDVFWDRSAKQVSIRPLLTALSFTTGRKNWGYLFRRGFFPIEEADFRLLAESMGARLSSW